MLKRLLSISIIIVLAFGTVQSVQAAKYKKYSNVRFGYVISYPKYFKARPESTNGDGRSFVYKKADISVWGQIASDMSGKKIKTGKQIKKYLNSFSSIKMKKVKVKKDSLYYETSSGKYKIFNYVKYNKKCNSLVTIELSCKNKIKHYRKMEKKIIKKLKLFKGLN